MIAATRLGQAVGPMAIVRRLRRLMGRQPGLAPSLYDLVPHADTLPRSMPRTELVSADSISGTTRHPANTTADFLPRRELRTLHWRDDWRRILEAQERLVVLPPVELVKVAERYFVIDGHKRVAAARRASAVLDAIVVELHPPRAAVAGQRRSARPLRTEAAGA